MWGSLERRVLALTSAVLPSSLPRRLFVYYGTAFCIGAGLELGKIFWRPLGINFYEVSRRKNFQKEMDAYAAQLKQIEAAVIEEALGGP